MEECERILFNWELSGPLSTGLNASPSVSSYCFADGIRQLGETLYDIKAPSKLEENEALDAQDDKDIASSIEDEIKRMKKDKTSKADYTFIPVRSGIECVFFMKTRSPVEPVEFVNRICDDAEKCTDMTERKLRHINRLTPVVLIGKSLDSGIEKVAREVLKSTFALNPENASEPTTEAEEEADGAAHSVGIIFAKNMFKLTITRD